MEPTLKINAIMRFYGTERMSIIILLQCRSVLKQNLVVVGRRVFFAYYNQ